jgi:hypothetical protein
VIPFGPLDNPGCSPHLKSLNLITLAKSLLPCRVTGSSQGEKGEMGGKETESFPAGGGVRRGSLVEVTLELSLKE